jgi:hypothetical protein
VLECHGGLSFVFIGPGGCGRGALFVMNDVCQSHVIRLDGKKKT